MTKREEQKTEEWLERAFYAKAEKKAIEEQIREIQAQYTSVTANLSGMPSGNSKDPHKLENYAIATEDLTKKLNELTGIQNEVRKSIERVKDGNLRTLLTARYMNGKSWEQVSDLLHYDYQGGYIFVLRRRALEKVKLYSEKQ